MSPELRKRLAQKAIDDSMVAIDFMRGAELMYKEEVVPRDELIKQMKEFCDHGLNWNTSRVALFQFEIRAAINKLEKGGEG